MEGPLFQDGALPTVDTGTTSRIVQFDLDGNVVAQYAYELDPLQAAPAGPDADFADNGATEILAVDDTTFLVVVSDNDFDESSVTQFLAFEVLPS